MSVTLPILTPRKVTGDPIARPEREDSRKYKTASRVVARNLPPPNAIAPMSTSAIAPTTKPPISFGFAFLAILIALPRRIPQLAAKQEVANLWIRAFVAQHLRVTRGDHGLGICVEEHRVVADGENAGEFMGDHGDRGTEAVSQLENEVVQHARTDRVEASRRLVEEQDLRIQRHRPS